MDQARNPPSPPENDRPDDGLDFEHTDIEDARRVLDEESLSQFDVASVTPQAHWKKLRRRELPTDRALTGRAIDWLLALPPNLRPEQLGRQFPRIANALAEVWDDPEQCQAALARLLNDGRKGRKGFPAEVQAEIVALRDWTAPF